MRQLGLCMQHLYQSPPDQVIITEMKTLSDDDFVVVVVVVAVVQSFI
jgi:hypothetical protein